MFSLSTASGGKLSEFRMPRSDPDDHLNPQTQERVIKSASAETRGKPIGRRSATLGAGGGKATSGARRAARHLAP